MMNSDFSLSPEDFAKLGAGALSYIREMAGSDVVRMIGQSQLGDVPPEARLYCLFNATGQPISISGSKAMAHESAEEHNLVAISLH
jgi:hypothetical protein